MNSIASIIVAVAVSLGAAPAWAEAPNTGGKIKGKGSGKISVDDADRASSGSIDLGVTDIEGRIYKPSVFYVLARGNINYTGIEFRQNFLERIVRGAMKRPF